VDITFEVMQVDEEKVLETVAEEASAADVYEQQLEQQRKTIADLTQQNAEKDALISQTRGELQQTAAALAVLQQKLNKVATLAGLRQGTLTKAPARRHSIGMIQLNTRSESAPNLLTKKRMTRRGSVSTHHMGARSEGMVSGGSHVHFAKNVIESLLGGRGGDGRGERVFSPERPFARWDSDALCFLKKLGDRDVEGGDRIRAMDVINSGIRRGESEYVALLEHDGCVRRLLFGIAAELLDAEQKVQRVAAEVAPGLLDECVNLCVANQNADVVYEHLPSIFDNLFCVLDDAESKANHRVVRRGVDEIISNIIDRQTPGSPVDDAVTYLLCAHLYAI